MTSLLPQGFQDLERFLPYWDVPSSQERIARRSTASWEANKEFYDAIVPRGEEAMAHLDQFELHDIPEDSARLLRLMLALTHVSMAVEFHGQVIAPNCPYPNDIRITEGASPFG